MRRLVVFAAALIATVMITEASHAEDCIECHKEVTPNVVLDS